MSSDVRGIATYYYTQNNCQEESGKAQRHANFGISINCRSSFDPFKLLRFIFDSLYRHLTQQQQTKMILFRWFQYLSLSSDIFLGPDYCFLNFNGRALLEGLR
jgi:hypothetical protein